MVAFISRRCAPANGLVSNCVCVNQSMSSMICDLFDVK